VVVLLEAEALAGHFSTHLHQVDLVAVVKLELLTQFKMVKPTLVVVELDGVMVDLQQIIQVEMVDLEK
jgi:hypothetical protein